MAEVNRALDVVPNEPYFLNNRGFIYLEMDSLELALKDINQSILINPENGWAYRNKGIYMIKKGEFALAVDLLDRAIQSGEFIDELYYFVGDAYYKNGDTSQACNYWRQGAQINEQRSQQMLDQYCD